MFTSTKSLKVRGEWNRSGGDGLVAIRSAERLRRPLQQLRPSLRDLVGMNVKLSNCLRQLGQRLVALQGRQRHLRFERPRVVPSLPACHALAPK
jgi:hypothetical protein